MAVYKVIQDIEAEDKLVGFLTLKTFIYAIIACLLAYINLRLIMASVIGPLRLVFVLILLFPMFVFGILAAPLGRDQPTEVWILSHIRFFITPRKRTWDQSGAQELVTITAPKKVEQNLTKNLSQREVQSRLKALATTLDSRGWAVKNVAVNLNSNPSYFDAEEADSDRLISASSMAQSQPVVDVHAADDIMDEQNNPTAQKFEALMQKADEQRKKDVVDRVNKAREEVPLTQPVEPPPDYTFIDKAPAAIDEKGNTKFVGHKIIAPGSETDNEDTSSVPLNEDEQNLLSSIHQKEEEIHKRSVGFKPKTTPKKAATAKAQPAPAQPEKPQVSTTVTENAQNAKLKELIEVGKHDKLSTLAKEANRKAYQIKQIGPNEVEIDLH